MVESGAERHPIIAMACAIAFQGRHDEGVLERTNLILYKRFRKNIDEWRKLRAKDFEEAGIKKEVLCVVGGTISLVLPWNAFASPDYEFKHFPHSDVVDILSPACDGGLFVYAYEGEIGIVNRVQACNFVFQFGEENLVTRGMRSAAFRYCDPMEGKSLMTKLSAAAEFIDMFDMKLSDFGALIPTKAS